MLIRFTYKKPKHLYMSIQNSILMVIGRPLQTEQFSLKGDAAKAELTALVTEILEWMGPSHEKIDDLVPEKTLHMYDPHLVADVAMELGLTVVQCCDCRDYRVNGVWLPDSTRVQGYPNLSHSFCGPCETKFRDKWDLHEPEPAKSEPDACYHH